jgi:hypothetical protein
MCSMGFFVDHNIQSLLSCLHPLRCKKAAVMRQLSVALVSRASCRLPRTSVGMLQTATAKTLYGYSFFTSREISNHRSIIVTQDYNIKTGAEFFANILAANNGDVFKTVGTYNGWHPSMTYVRMTDISYIGRDFSNRTSLVRCYECDQYFLL